MGSEIVYSLVKCYNWALADTAQLPSTGHKLLLRGLACVYFLKNANYHHDKLNTATAPTSILMKVSLTQLYEQ